MRTIRITLLAAAAVLLAVTPVAHASVQSGSRNCAQPDGRVSSSTIRSGIVYLGGSFTHVKDRQGVSRPRTGLAAISLDSCELLPWSADTNGDVYAVKAVGASIYVGGDFTRVDGTARARLAAVAADTSQVRAFNPGVNGPVRALAVSEGKVYAGGSFTQVGGVGRGHLAAFNRDTGQLSRTWKPTTTGSVLTLSSSPERRRIYVGGSFTALNGMSAHRYLGAVDPTQGQLRERFRPRVDFPVLSVTAKVGGVYAGGGGHGGHLAIWNADGSLQRPLYQTDGGVQAVKVHGNSLYAGGHFTNYCIGNTGSGSPYTCDRPLQRRKLFEVSLVTGHLTGWAPSLNSPRGVFTESVPARTGDLWVGGDFTTVNSTPQAHLAAFRADARN